MTVPCWPNGSATRRGACDAEIPDSDHATMTRYGWGFTLGPDAGSPTGDGFFYACPEHRSDCTDDQRIQARERNAIAMTPAHEGEPT